VASILWPFAFQQGCLFPGIGLVRGLQAAGHSITALGAAPAESLLRQLGIDFVADAYLHPERRPPVVGVPTDWEMARELLAYRAESTMDHVAQLLDEGQFDLVFADAFRVGAGFAAERASLRFAAYTHHYFDETDVSEALLAMFWENTRPAVALRDGFRAWWFDLRDRLGVGPEPLAESEIAWWNLSSQLTLVTGLPELKVHRAVVTPTFVHRVGPVLWDQIGINGQYEPPSWLHMIGRDRPAVMVALSSGVNDADLLATALTAFRDDEFDLVATTPVGTPSAPDRAGVYFADHVAHSLLVPRVSAVIATGGHGTVNRFAATGVPAVLVPRAYDQPLLAEAAKTAGVARVVDHQTLTPDELRSAITDVITSDAIATALRSAMRSASGYDAPNAAGDLVNTIFDSTGGQKA
jgi:UDP:flavonoid glycosyltransferase YjiC (YdhE family)